MEPAAPTVRDLAQLLLVLEANQNEHTDGNGYAFPGVYAKLCLHLSRLVGVIGFQALAARALILSKAEVSWLEAVRVQADATLEGFSEAAQPLSGEAVAEGSVVLLAQLLGLLITFIGEALTLRLVGNIWPEAQGDSIEFLVQRRSQHE